MVSVSVWTTPLPDLHTGQALILSRKGRGEIKEGERGERKEWGEGREWRSLRNERITTLDSIFPGRTGNDSIDARKE
jgi:hypothetical protein